MQETAHGDATAYMSVTTSAPGDASRATMGSPIILRIRRSTIGIADMLSWCHRHRKNVCKARGVSRDTYIKRKGAHCMTAPDAFSPLPGVTATQLEQWMTAAHPRLLRLARTYGITAETAHDVVQETLLEAWRHLDAIVEPEGFTAWLAAICRNVCRRYHRAHSEMMQRELPWGPSPVSSEEEHDSWLFPHGIDVPDHTVVDPLEDLGRQDLATLLDHALGQLPPSAREAIALCY